jgi:signal recognition particle GTPase
MRNASSQEKSMSRHTIYTHLHMVDVILDIAKEQKLGPLGRFVKVLPALGRRLII